MDKNREHQTVFRWRKDANGYALTDSGDKIVRRGGKMVEYDPNALPFPLHRVFAEIMSQSRVVAENYARELSDDPQAPFYMRAFDDVPSAMLAFVNEFGFLGSDRTGADAESEELAYLYKLTGELRELLSWANLLQQYPRSGKKGAIVKTPIPGTDRIEDRYAPANLRDALEHVELWRDEIVGPNLRMVVGRSARHGGIEVRYEPESLYAWMWMRTAEDFNSGIDWSGPPCLYCLEPMGRGPRIGTGRRNDAKFCTGNHRVYFYRLPTAEKKKRRKQARELARGHSSAMTEGD